MTLGYASPSTARTSWWAICCGSLALLLLAFAVAQASFVVYPLPFVTEAVGHAYRLAGIPLSVSRLANGTLICGIAAGVLLFVGNPRFWLALLTEAITGDQSGFGPRP